MDPGGKKCNFSKIIIEFQGYGKFKMNSPHIIIYLYMFLQTTDKNQRAEVQHNSFHSLDAVTKEGGHYTHHTDTRHTRDTTHDYSAERTLSVTSGSRF